MERPKTSFRGTGLDSKKMYMGGVGGNWGGFSRIARSSWRGEVKNYIAFSSEKAKGWLGAPLAFSGKKGESATTQSSLSSWMEEGGGDAENGLTSKVRRTMLVVCQPGRVRAPLGVNSREGWGLRRNEDSNPFFGRGEAQGKACKGYWTKGRTSRFRVLLKRPVGKVKENSLFIPVGEAKTESKSKKWGFSQRGRNQNREQKDGGKPEFCASSTTTRWEERRGRLTKWKKPLGPEREEDSPSHHYKETVDHHP